MGLVAKLGRTGSFSSIQQLASAIGYRPIPSKVVHLLPEWQDCLFDGAGRGESNDSTVEHS